MSHPIPSTVRADDLLRHLQDLRSGTYEGAMSRGAKEVVYHQGVELLRPVAVEILEEANTFAGTHYVGERYSAGGGASIQRSPDESCSERAMSARRGGWFVPA